MRTSYLYRKLAPPTLPKVILRRPSLLVTLKEALSPNAAGTFSYKLLLLCAPSGYGKTVLLTDFLQQSELPGCWYILDQTDTDAIVFLRALIASLRQQFPAFAPDLERTLKDIFTTNISHLPEASELECVIDAILEAIENDIPERFVLVLVNYHEIRSSLLINRLLNRLLNCLPDHVTLIIESRSVPALDLLTLLAQRKIFGLGNGHFRLTREELHTLAQIQGEQSLTDEEADYLVKTFDGWITGILLGTHLGNVQLLQNHPLDKQTRSEELIPIQRQQLLAYVVNDVFSKEPEVYQFLKEAIILQQMTPLFCNLLLERDDSEAHLLYLEDHGLFVNRHDGGDQAIWVCHPVIYKLLSKQLQETNPERFAHLHRRAALLFEKTQDYNQAIYHALQADYPLAARLISEVYRPMVDKGHLQTIEQWMNCLPTEIFSLYPQLLIARANLYLATGNQQQASIFLEKAEVLLALPSLYIETDEVPWWQYEMLLARSKILWLDGQYTQTQLLCQQVLSDLPMDEVRLRAEAHLRLGMCFIRLGEITAGIQALHQALQLSGQDTYSRQKARLHSQLANAYHLLGNHALSKHHRAHAAHCWERLSDQQGKVKNMIEVSIVLRRTGCYDEAETTLQQALRHAREIHFRQGESYALVSLGDVYQDQRQYEHALMMIEEGLALARQLGDSYLTIYSLCSLAGMYLQMGDIPTAQFFLTDVDLSNKSSTCSITRQVLYGLTYGTALLYQQQYEQAMIQLREVEQNTLTRGLKREHLQCLMRLAACMYGKGDKYTSIDLIQKAIREAFQYGYEKLIEIESQNLPYLSQALQELQEMVQLQKSPVPVTSLLDASPEGLLPRPAPDQAPKLQIRGFGEPVVLVDGQPITRWRVVRAIELFFFLLDHPNPVHKEHIIADLWTESDEKELVDQKFRTAIYYLRKALGEACVVAHRGYYNLHLQAVYDTDLDYDVYAFQMAAHQAQVAGTHDMQEAHRALTQMVTLYQGDFLQPFYSNWCQKRRNELRRMYIEACHSLADRAMQQGAWKNGLEYFHRLLALDSCLEEAHLGVMRCYMEQGKRGLALRQYQRCVLALREEMDITPGIALQNFYQQIIEQGEYQERGLRDVTSRSPKREK